MIRGLLILLLLHAAPSARAADDTLKALFDGQGDWTAQTGLQIVTLKAGRVDQSLAFGDARLSPTVALRTDHKIRVASISKLVTAIAVMQLAEREAISLDRDVSLYLGWRLRNPHFPDRAITLAQLLSHTSSLRDGDRYWLAPGHSIRDFFLQDGNAYDGGNHFAQESGRGPGDYFTYANINFAVIAAVVETISGERFDRYVSTHIMAPLGLTASFSACDTPHEQLATLYRSAAPQVDGGTLHCHYGSPPVTRGDGTAHAQLVGYRPGENPTLFSPQGGLRASAEDLAVIMQMLMGRGAVGGIQILSPQSVELMLSPRWILNAGGSNGSSSAEGGPNGLMTAYGLSVHIAQLHQWGLSDTPKTLFGHLGDAYGLLGHFWFDPETNNGFISLITGTDTPPQDDEMGYSPLYRVEEEILRWWLRHQND